MKINATFYPATGTDSLAIAELVAMSSEGVALIEWVEEARQRPGLTPLDVGQSIYGSLYGDYSFRNCVIARVGESIAGMLLSFAVDEPTGNQAASPPPYDGSDVFAPYRYLEAPNTWYVCGVALYPPFRGLGIGTRFMAIARDQARERGYERMSLVAFEQNRGAVRLYRRLGYEIVKRAPIVPHPLIRCSGDALLMVAPV